MANSTNSLSHTRWLCKYHVVIVPKYRRNVIYNQQRKDLEKADIALDKLSVKECVKPKRQRL